MTMDISDTLAPNSDQLDACDLTTGPRIFTIKGVIKGNDEQPVQVQLVEFPRVWRPSKGMRRVLASCWGVDASAWIGRRVELYCDPTVIFGREAVGGTRISRLSDIDKEQKIPLLVSRGKSAVFTVRPLAASEGGQSHVTPSQDPPAADRSAMAGTSATADRQQNDAAADQPEPLLDAITRQIAEITEEGGGAHLKTWWASIGIGSSKRALIDRFGEDARDIRKLMGQP